MSMKNLLNDQEYDIQKHLAQLKEKIKEMGKMKTQEKLSTAEKLRQQMRKLMNQIKSYQLSILDAEMQQSENDKFKEPVDIAKLKQNLKSYEQKIQALRQNLQYTKNERVNTEDLFEGRKPKIVKNGMNERDVYIQQMQEAGQQGLTGVKNVARMAYEMEGVADTINENLQSQIQKLDSIYTQLHQTETTMKRAQKHINQFARNLYTDKLLMGLIVIIVIAIVVIIILSALGKTPSDLVPDTIK